MHLKPIRRIPLSKATVTRQIVFAQQNMPNGMPMLTLNGKTWEDPITEKPVLGSTEIWNLVNTLPDTHPFHVHLVTFQVIDRTPFGVDAFSADGRVAPTGPAEAPDPNEMGWKDVVRVPPNRVTRIILHFSPYAGYYVYHCHILEHEDMDMMRPFQVVPRSAPHRGRSGR